MLLLLIIKQLKDNPITVSWRVHITSCDLHIVHVKDVVGLVHWMIGHCNTCNSTSIHAYGLI